VPSRCIDVCLGVAHGYLQESRMIGQ
jgi:hypothetical protein